MATVTSAIRQDILDRISGAGFDLERVTYLTVTLETKVLYAGEDYDPYYRYSEPGDNQVVVLPERLDFDYNYGRAVEHVTI